MSKKQMSEEMYLKQADLELAAKAIREEIAELFEGLEDKAKYILEDISLLEKNLEGINSLRCEIELNFKQYA